MNSATSLFRPPLLYVICRETSATGPCSITCKYSIADDALMLYGKFSVLIFPESQKLIFTIFLGQIGKLRGSIQKLVRNFSGRIQKHTFLIGFCKVLWRPPFFQGLRVSQGHKDHLVVSSLNLSLPAQESPIH